jgi:GNAT superfamily N-acetyltransferase
VILTIAPVAYSAEAFAPMLAEAEAGQGAFLIRLRDEWLSGAMRFDQVGEILLGAWADGALVGVGGISQDPYAPAPDLGRVRHVYVLRAQRGRGIARKLVAALVDHARGRFAVLRLRTRNPAAARLYESLGFTASAAPEETHRLLL